MASSMRPQYALRCAWASLSSLSTSALTHRQVLYCPQSGHLVTRRTTPLPSAQCIHSSARLFRQRRWREGNETNTAAQRDTRSTDDDYINYTARIQPLGSTPATPLQSLTITPSSTVLASASASSPASTPSSAVVHLTATPESAEPPPSSAEYREALFAARDTRRAEAALLRAVHSSGPSRRVRKWHSNQKRLRTRADRRRRKYHMNQSYEREEHSRDKDASKYPSMQDKR